MSENFLALSSGCLAGLLLVLVVVRTVLAERRAGVGGGEPRTVRRSAPVLVLDGVGVLVVIVLLAALAGRIAVALSHN